jgi:hypothetical protein
MDAMSCGCAWFDRPFFLPIVIGPLVFLSEEIRFRSTLVGNGFFLLAKFPDRPVGPAVGGAALLASTALLRATG